MNDFYEIFWRVGRVRRFIFDFFLDRLKMAFLMTLQLHQLYLMLYLIGRRFSKLFHLNGASG